VRPPPGGVRQRESDSGQILVGGVPVDAVAPGIGLDGDGGAGGDPGPGGLTAGLPAHPVPARLHAGRIRAAWRSRSRHRRETPATRRQARRPQLPMRARFKCSGDRAYLDWICTEVKEFSVIMCVASLPVRGSLQGRETSNDLVKVAGATHQAAL
jgi:hypothetical protein